jgi:hypothetical protein
MRLARVFEQPVVIVFALILTVVFAANAAKIIGAYLPTTGPLAGVGDAFRNT